VVFPDAEELIRGELFSIERLEQHEPRPQIRDG